jgi:hypothetical protein
MRPRDALTTLAAVLLAACGKEDTSPRPTGSTPSGTTKTPTASSGGSGIPVSDAPVAEEHSHEARHGGLVVELGAHEGHLEIVHDEATGTVTAYVYDADMNPVDAEAPVVNLTRGAVQVAMTPVTGAGPRASAWKAVHESLKAEPLEGRVRLKIGDKTYQASLEAAPQ